jgi:endonuclease V-like protein UPF0215 family
MDLINFGRCGNTTPSTLDLISTISLRSRDGINATDTASHFTNASTTFITPRLVQLIDAAVTINNYNLQDVIYLEETGFPVIPFSLPPAIYNDTNIAAALQLAMNTVTLAGNVYTVTLNNVDYSITITAVGVTWRFVNVNTKNGTYYALGIATSAIPPLATPALSFTFGAYDLRPYDILYIDINGMVNGNINGGSRTATFTLTCSSVNSGGIATYTAQSNDLQYWVNTMFQSFGQYTVTIRDTYGNQIPLRAGSTSILLSFTRLSC